MIKQCDCHPGVDTGTGELCLNCNKFPQDHNTPGYCRNSTRQSDWWNHRKAQLNNKDKV